MKVRSTVVGISLALSVVAALSACASPPAAPAPPAVAAPTTPIVAAGPTAPINVSFDSEAVRDALREVATLTHRTLVIEPSAERYASCARVTIATPGPVAGEQLLTLLADALSSSGFQLAIRDDVLVLTHDGRTVPATCAPEPTPVVGAPEGPETAGSTRMISETEWEVTRAWRDAALADPRGLVDEARMVPAEVEGRVTGFRFFGIRRGSRFAAVGFQNGDTLSSINGFAVTSVEAALEAYARLHAAERYDVVLERHGATRTHVIHVVETLGDASAEPPSPH